jgi:hypothetical protein
MDKMQIEDIKMHNLHYKIFFLKYSVILIKCFKNIRGVRQSQLLNHYLYSSLQLENVLAL